MVVKKKNDIGDFTIRAIMVKAVTDRSIWRLLVELVESGIVTRFDGHEEFFEKADAWQFSDFEIQAWYKNIELFYLLDDHEGKRESAPVPRNAFVRFITSNLNLIIMLFLSYCEYPMINCPSTRQCESILASSNQIAF